MHTAAMHLRNCCLPCTTSPWFSRNLTRFGPACLKGSPWCLHTDCLVIQTAWGFPEGYERQKTDSKDSAILRSALVRGIQPGYQLQLGNYNRPFLAGLSVGSCCGLSSKADGKTGWYKKL